MQHTSSSTSTSPLWYGNSPHYSTTPISGATRHAQDNETTQETPQKKFRVLNRLERKGADHIIKDLEQRIRVRPSANDEIALFRAKLSVMESCYQSRTDQFQQQQQAIQQAQAGTQQRDLRIAALERELANAKGIKREREEECETLQKKCDDNKRRLAAVEAENQKLSEDLQNQKTFTRKLVEELDAKKLDLKVAQEKFAELEKTQLQLTRAKRAKEMLLQEANGKNEKLQQEIADLNQKLAAVQQTLHEREVKIVELNITIADHQRCVRVQKVAIDKLENHSISSRFK